MRLGLRWARLWPAVAFGLAGVLVPAAWFGPVLAQSRNPVSLLLFLGLPGLAAAAAGALLGRPPVAPLFAPMFATVIKWTEPGRTTVRGE